MFGYIKPRTPELLVREHELYKSIYCGLCHAIDTNVSGLSTLVLNYDVVFLVLFRLAATGEKINVEKKRCIAHPLRPRAVAFSEPAMRFCAGISAVLSYYKLKDDLNDERGFDRFKKTLALPFLSGFRRKAGADEELENIISSRLDELDALEHTDDPSPDACAEIFGLLLGEICAFGIEEDNQASAKEFGTAVGRWIYLLDALDDHAEDAAKGRFNPFSSYSLDDLPVEQIVYSLDFELTRAIKAFDRLGCEDDPVSGIIYNVLKCGMPDAAAKILKQFNYNGAVN